MMFKVKGQSHIKMRFNQHMSKNVRSRELVCHEQPHNQPWGQNVRITFQIKSQGHRVNTIKPFSYKLLVVDSSF